MKYLTGFFFFILCSCTTVKHKSISQTYHGINDYGGHWLLWRMPNKTLGDSVTVHVSGFNVSEQHKVKFGVLYIYFKNGTSKEFSYTDDYSGINIKIPAGKYKLGFQPDLPARSIKTNYFKFTPGDSIALVANVVNPERHLSENWNLKYMNAKQLDRYKKKRARFIERLEKLKRKNKTQKYLKLRERKKKKWPLYHYF